MDSTVMTGSFSGANNSGPQVAQNAGWISTGPVHIQTQPSTDEEWTDERCHQLFRLTQDGRGEGYEWYKSRIDERVEGTCNWFLNHEKYQSWKKGTSGPLLVSADPGCGKSVLAKFLIDHDLNGHVLYFFFKDQDTNTLRQAVCALLHQLFSHHPALVKLAAPECKKNGRKLLELTGLLWGILAKAIHELESSITIVLDALDECIESDMQQLLQCLRDLYNQGAQPKVKFLLTSRPYHDIMSEFWELSAIFPEIRIPGEEYSDEISAEVNYVIAHGAAQLAAKFNLNNELKQHLHDKVSEIPHRTYLWVYLVFEHLNRGFRKTKNSLEYWINTLPNNVSEAYEQVLSRSKDEDNVRTCLSIIVGAARPLTVVQMNIAVRISQSPDSRSVEDLDLEETADFVNTLRDWCGLFVSVHHGRVYLLHQTAREFLLPQYVSPQRPLDTARRWRGSIEFDETQAILADICIIFLRFKDLDAKISKVRKLLELGKGTWACVPAFSLFQYASEFWPGHFRKAGAKLFPRTLLEASDLIVGTLADDCWFQTWLRGSGSEIHLPEPLSPLLMASCLGLDRLVHQFCFTQDLDSTDSHGVTALHFAAKGGSVAICQLLTENGANLNIKDRSGFRPIQWAIRGGQLQVVQLLLKLGAAATYSARPAIESVLQSAVYSDISVPAIKILLESGANVNERNCDGRTCLHAAVENIRPTERMRVIQLILNYGADVNAQDLSGMTPLHAAYYSEEVTALLVQNGANPKIQDNIGCMALHEVAQYGRESDANIARTLLDNGSNINQQDRYGRTPLILSAERGSFKLVQLLLDRGANADITDYKKRNALHMAVHNSEAWVAHLLVGVCTDINAQDELGCTALHYAVMSRCYNTIKLLIKAGAKTTIPDGEGNTA